jgi:radical SAM protein (TIGR01212 family)
VGFVPYLQSNTNTYGDVEYLSQMYFRAAEMEGAVMLDIATRADCLGDDIVREIVKIAEHIPVTVELGLQSTNDSTAELINRGHTFADFVDGYTRLRDAASEINRTMSESADGLAFPRISIGVHLINGLPGESREDMLRSAADVALLKPELVKLHLMHVLRDTRLASLYERGEYVPMERDDYVATVCDQLEILPESTVIGRVTGDGMADDLLAPLWSRRKTEVANEIDKEMFRRGSYQGKFAK